jgi:hypothetical protein
LRGGEGFETYSLFTLEQRPEVNRGAMDVSDALARFLSLSDNLPVLTTIQRPGLRY